MTGSHAWTLAVTASLTACVASCGPDAGEEGSEILRPFTQLSGGVVFATRAVAGANGYDLFWADVPFQQTTSFRQLVQLTDAGGDEWQPSVSPGGNGLAYARPGEGIFLVGRDSVVRRIAQSDDRYNDSLPAVSFDGALVAWVRVDTARPIAGTEYFETAIWIANSDGSGARPVAAEPGVVQSGPRFPPAPDMRALAWTEFDPTSIGAFGPERYALRVHDLVNNINRVECRDPGVTIGGTFQRCFGPHLAWPRRDVIIVTQSFMEIYLDGRPPEEVYSNVLSSAAGQPLSAPIIQQTEFGFTTFPVSASYLGDRMIFDGVVASPDGNQPTLALWVAIVDGTGVWRLPLAGHQTDIDLDSTRGYRFSVATPQLMP